MLSAPVKFNAVLVDYLKADVVSESLLQLYLWRKLATDARLFPQLGRRSQLAGVSSLTRLARKSARPGKTLPRYWRIGTCAAFPNAQAYKAMS
jgi:hypothetical protein